MLHRCPAVLLLLLAPGMAQAHAVLMASQPAADGTVSAGETTVSLEYNSRIDQARSRVTLSRLGAPDERLALQPAQRPDILQARAKLAPGAYVLHWFVLATDGHITRGDVPFTVGR